MSQIFTNNIKNYLKNKKILVAQWESGTKNDKYSYTRWYLPFKGIAKKISLFSAKTESFRYGKQKMGENLLKMIEKEKPAIIFFLIIYDEFDPGTLAKIKKLYPNIKMINVFGDDSWRYEDFGRPYSLFFDYIVTILAPEALKKYKNDGINNVFLSYSGVNTDQYRPLKLYKEYDVGFVGSPAKQRESLIRAIKNKGIDVHIWGHGWDSFSELGENYHGPLPADKWSEVVNKIKINLNFSLGGYGRMQIKGRPWEIGACEAFVLSEYFKGYEKFFKNNKEIVFFKNEKDLLKKIKYYLKNEREREKIAKNMYYKILNKYSLKAELNELFDKIRLDERKGYRKSTIPMKKVVYLNIRELNRDFTDKLKNADYVCLKTDDDVHPLRDYIQSYCLNKSKKQISFCDYYVCNKNLGNYILFKACSGFNNLNKKDFDRFVNLGSLMFTKKYFIANLNIIKKAFSEKKFTLINKENTNFVSIPLIETKNLVVLNNGIMKKAFQMKFIENAYSLYWQNNLMATKYLLTLVFESMRGKPFILDVIKENLFDMGKLAKLIKGF